MALPALSSPVRPRLGSARLRLVPALTTPARLLPCPPRLGPAQLGPAPFRTDIAAVAGGPSGWSIGAGGRPLQHAPPWPGRDVLGYRAVPGAYRGRTGAVLGPCSGTSIPGGGRTSDSGWTLGGLSRLVTTGITARRVNGSLSVNSASPHGTGTTRPPPYAEGGTYPALLNALLSAAVC